MTDKLKFEMHDNTALITIDNPAANTWDSDNLQADASVSTSVGLTYASGLRHSGLASDAFASFASLQSTHLRNFVSAPLSERNEYRNFHSSCLYSGVRCRVGGSEIAAASDRFSFPFGFKS